MVLRFIRLSGQDRDAQSYGNTLLFVLQRQSEQLCIGKQCVSDMYRRYTGTSMLYGVFQLSRRMDTGPSPRSMRQEKLGHGRPHK